MLIGEKWVCKIGNWVFEACVWKVHKAWFKDGPIAIKEWQSFDGQGSEIYF
jgi:hypothetical protein